MVSRIADEGDYKYGKLNTIGWLKSGVEEVASRRALLMVCGHDEKLKTRYACLNVLSTAEMYNIYFGWEFRDKGGNGRSVLLSLNSYIDSQLDRTMVFPPFRPSFRDAEGSFEDLSIIAFFVIRELFFALAT